MSKIGRGRRAAIATRELNEKTKKAIVGRKVMSDRAYSVVKRGERNYGTEKKPYIMPILQFIREKP